MPDPGFLGVPGVDALTFAILTGAAVLMTWISIVTGAAGGLMLLLVMAGLVPAPVLVPIHTIVQLGAGTTRAFFMWGWVLKGTLLPFLFGSVVGAALGAQIAISLPVTVLQGLLGLLILAIVWMPRIGRVGAGRGKDRVKLGRGVGVDGVDGVDAGVVAVAAEGKDERAALMGPCEKPWNLIGDPLGVTIRAYGPETAKHVFLQRFKKLTKAQK